MKNSIRISLTNPCSENFENFRSTPKGGFCGSCQKEVIDFTGLSDAALFAHFETRKGKTCGRFKSTQLTTYGAAHLKQNEITTNFISRSLGIFSFSLLALCAITNSQAQAPKTVGTLPQTEIQAVQEFESAHQMVQDAHIIKGTVIDEDKLPLPGVNVVLKGTTQGVVTDLDGKFEFPTALEIDDTLVFSYIGYEAKEYTVSASASDTIDITITFDFSDVELMGEIVVGGAYKTKRTIFQKFLAIFK